MSVISVKKKKLIMSVTFAKELTSFFERMHSPTKTQGKNWTKTTPIKTTQIS